MSERWEIAFLKFAADQTDAAYVNAELAKCPGWEPFDSCWQAGTWVLLLRRRAALD